MNEAEPIKVDLSWPGGEARLSFLISPVFGEGDEYPVQIAATAGAFRGRASQDVISLPCFVRDLERLYETMSGEARLFGWDERHAVLRLFALRQGRIGLEVRVASDQFSDPDEVLSVRGYIDQSYLPPVLAGFRKAAKAGPELTKDTVPTRRTLMPRGVLRWTVASLLAVVPAVILTAELLRPDPNELFLIRGVGGLLLLAMLFALGERELRAGR